MDKLVKHNDTWWSLFYTPHNVRHCADLVVKNNKVVGVSTVWVCMEDGYDDGVIVDTNKYYADYHELIERTVKSLL